jgi:hypothetical protein
MAQKFELRTSALIIVMILEGKTDRWILWPEAGMRNNVREEYSEKAQSLIRAGLQL